MKLFLGLFYFNFENFISYLYLVQYGMLQLWFYRFSRGHFPLSVNMDPTQLEQFAHALRLENKKYHVVLGKRGDLGPQVCDLNLLVFFLKKKG